MTPPFQWTDLSADPNAPAVVRRRQDVLDATRRPPVSNRLQLLRSLASGREVLDIGVVEHFFDNQQKDRWLHRNLVEVATSCKGVDILADDVAKLRDQGFDVVVHDLTEKPLEQQFDVAVMGEVLEHLGCPEVFLVNVRRSLRPGGRLVMTTPNPYMLHRTWKSLRGEFPDSVDHSLLLGPGNVLELATRAGFELDAWRGVRLKDLPGARNRATALLRRVLVRLGFAEEIACDTLVYELVPATG